MRVRAVKDEDFVNYRLPSMYIITATCDWKCCTEQNLDISICQNSPLVTETNIVDIDDEIIYRHFHKNDITKAVVIGGLEPFLQFDELVHLINVFRSHDEYCDFVIYTGYDPEEIGDEIRQLSEHNNIIVKFGRYIPNSKSKNDEVLGVTLASDNQYAVRLRPD